MLVYICDIVGRACGRCSGRAQVGCAVKALLSCIGVGDAGREQPRGKGDGTHVLWALQQHAPTDRRVAQAQSQEAQRGLVEALGLCAARLGVSGV